MHMLYHTVLPTAVCSFIVAVNAPFLSFSPLKIREHTRLGCVRQSIPRLMAGENVGLTALSTGADGRVLGNLRACG